MIQVVISCFGSSSGDFHLRYDVSEQPFTALAVHLLKVLVLFVQLAKLFHDHGVGHNIIRVDVVEIGLVVQFVVSWFGRCSRFRHQNAIWVDDSKVATLSSCRLIARRLLDPGVVARVAYLAALVALVAPGQ